MRTFDTDSGSGKRGVGVDAERIDEWACHEDGGAAVDVVYQKDRILDMELSSL